MSVEATYAALHVQTVSSVQLCRSRGWAYTPCP